MFGPLVKMLNNIKKLDENQLCVKVFILPEIKQFIVKLNLVDQLYTEGVDVNDRVIGTYSYLTAIKNGEEHFIYNGLVSVKKPGEPYTLYDTGEFYQSFSVKVDKTGFTIEADTVKPDKDLLDYGDIIGLTNDSKEKLSKKMLPFLQKVLREEILKEILR